MARKKTAKKSRTAKNPFKGKKIVFATDKRVRELGKFCDEVLRAICKVSGLSSGAWISDESCVGDFPIDEKNIQQLRDRLSVSVEVDDYIVDVAQRIKDAS